LATLLCAAEKYTIVDLGTWPGAGANLYGRRLDPQGQPLGSVTLRFPDGSNTQEAAIFARSGPVLLGFCPGGTASVAYARDGVNGIVGLCEFGHGAYNHGFWRYNGVMHDLGAIPWTPDAFSVALDLNARYIVGFGDTGNTTAAALIWRRIPGAKPQILPTLGGPSAYALRITDRDVIIGESDTSNGNLHATVWINRQPRDLTPGNISFSSAAAGNNAGVIVGVVDINFYAHAWRWTLGGGSEDLGVYPGDGQAYLKDINASGVAVGYGIGGAQAPQYRAILAAIGQPLVDLNTLVHAPDWVLEETSSINDSGVILGSGTFQGHHYRPFLLIPIHGRQDNG
jgi:uncharacterized membrane protein